jgi:hypothetical protein
MPCAKTSAELGPGSSVAVSAVPKKTSHSPKLISFLDHHGNFAAPVKASAQRLLRTTMESGLRGNGVLLQSE